MGEPRVEQRHAAKAEMWLREHGEIIYPFREQDYERLGALVADTERAALDRAATACDAVAGVHLKAERGAREDIEANNQHIAFIGANACAEAVRALAAAPTTEDRT